LGLLRVSPSTEMNSETVSPIPPRAFNSRRKEISVTPAIGESTSGGLISMLRILKDLILFIKKPHEILPHVALMYDKRRRPSPLIRRRPSNNLSSAAQRKRKLTVCVGFSTN